VLNSFVIIDSTNLLSQKIESIPFLEGFLCIGVFDSYETALKGVLTQKPQLILFHFNDSIALSLLLELYHYLETLPYVIAVNEDSTNAYSALKLGVSDYLIHPVDCLELHKSFLKFLKSYKNSDLSSKLCIKSSSDYQFISLEDIVYLKADNNTTDFYLKNGKIVSGFKTMKFYESQLPFYFFRIHHSFIVNIHFVSRINLSKNDCYLHGNEFKLSFSRTYKDQIDIILKRIG
jgi:DNA-binding LytR/AlgR family response regulator